MKRMADDIFHACFGREREGRGGRGGGVVGRQEIPPPVARNTMEDNRRGRNTRPRFMLLLLTSPPLTSHPTFSLPVAFRFGWRAIIRQKPSRFSLCHPSYPLILAVFYERDKQRDGKTLGLVSSLFEFYNPSSLHVFESRNNDFSLPRIEYLASNYSKRVKEAFGLLFWKIVVFDDPVKQGELNFPPLWRRRKKVR